MADNIVIPKVKIFNYFYNIFDFLVFLVFEINYNFVLSPVYIAIK